MVFTDLRKNEFQSILIDYIRIFFYFIKIYDKNLKISNINHKTPVRDSATWTFSLFFRFFVLTKI